MDSTGQGGFHKPASLEWSPRTHSGLVGSGGVPRLSRWLDLGLAHYSTRAHIQTIQGRASGTKVKEARIQMQCHWGTQGSRGRCVSFPHTLRGAVVTSQVTCYQPGNLLRGSAPRDFVGGIVTLASSSYLCQDPKFRLHKGRQILSKTHVICLSI